MSVVKLFLVLVAAAHALNLTPPPRRTRVQRFVAAADALTLSPQTPRITAATKKQMQGLMRQAGYKTVPALKTKKELQQDLKVAGLKTNGKKWQLVEAHGFNVDVSRAAEPVASIVARAKTMERHA